MSDDWMRVTTIRLPRALADKLELIARVNGVPMSEEIRQAITDHIEACRTDEGFMVRLKERVAADKDILERLSADDA